MGSPYRELQRVDAALAKSGEYVYRPLARNDRIAAGNSGIRLFMPPFVVALVAGNLFGLAVGTVTFAVLLTASVWWSRIHPTDVVVLRVASGELQVLPMGSKKVAFSLRLDELDDVVLETRSVERVLDVGANIVNIGMGPISPTIAPSTDTKRIALESAEGVHVLTTGFFGHSETTESFAKVRTFLRSMGWTPLTEREEEEDVEDD